MPQQLENVTVADAYSASATAVFQLPTFKVSAIVANQAVFYQVERISPGMRAGSGTWTPEEFLVPGVGSIIKPFLMGGIRFRNANSASPDAQVSARAA